MKIAVVGATGVVGASAVAARVAAGHDVFAMARTPEKASLLETWGANAVPADLFDHLSLVTMFEGCDVVVNTASRVPVGYRAALASSWRENDRLRTEGVRHVFGMVGHSNLGLADAIRRRVEDGEMEYIGIRHEGAAAFAAPADLPGRDY